MTGALYQHQQDGAAWLARNPKGYLAHKPGLGKTRTLIHAAQLAGVRVPLIVCPAIVRTHWLREMNVMGWQGDDQPAGVIISYDQITRGGNALMVKLLRDEKVDALILDEAHYLKHAGSKRTQQILGRDGYARRLDIVWPASGTPIPRNPAEIWTVLSALRPDVALSHGLKTYPQFVERFCVTRGAMARGVWREKVVGLKPEAEAELRAMLGEIMQVRGLDDVGLDVPAIDWQLMRLDAAEDDKYAFVEIPTALSVQSAITHERLADIADEPHIARMRRRLGELKAPLVVEMLNAQLEADPTLTVAVFAHHRSVLAELRAGLNKFAGVAYVDGDTPPQHRDREIQYFRSHPGVRVFIGQNIACSTGMDGLQHATNRAVLVEPDWTPDVNYQLGHRVARMGSEFDHAIVQLVALAGTLDEAIVAQNKRETEMVARAMPAGV